MNIKHMRRQKGITQLRLAEVLEVDQSTVSKWEQEVTMPNITMLKKIAKALDCSVDELLKEDT